MIDNRRIRFETFGSRFARYKGSRAISESENDADPDIPETGHFVENSVDTAHEERDGESDSGASENAAPKNPALVAATVLRYAASFMDLSICAGAPSDAPRDG